MFKNIKYSAYLLRIATVLAKHDALFFVDKLNTKPFPISLVRALSWKKSKKRPGERLAKALQELGPTFIKLGQALSVRSDIIGDEVAEDLSQLQDRLPPFSTKEARGIVEHELRRKIDDVFKKFDDQPVAAASIAQVHFAKTKDGKDLAVKVLRPGIEKAFAKDIRLFYWLAEIAEKAQPKLKRLKLKEVVENFEETVKFEMDLRIEAAAASELKENLKSDSGIVIPEIYWELTSRKVLVLEKVTGVRIDDKKTLVKKGHKLEQILTKASEIFFIQVFRDGFFHADMHPGNLFVDNKGNILAVDFGIMGRLDIRTRMFLGQMLLAFLNQDYQKVADVHFDAGYIPKDQSPELFALACRSIGEPIFGKPQKDISIAKLLSQLFKVSEDFGMETQPQLLLLQKTMVLAEGLARKLNADANFWQISRPLIEEWDKKNLAIESKIKDVKDDFKSIGKRFNNIVDAIDQIPNIITKDGIKLHPSTVEAFVKNQKQGFKYWKIVFISAISSFFTALVLYFILESI